MKTEISKTVTHSTRRENPAALLTDVIRKNPKKTRDQHMQAFRNLILGAGYEAFHDAILHEWIRLNYTRAFDNANPPTAKQVAAMAAERRSRVEHHKAKIGEKIFNLVMPNGKPLRECTGTECVGFGRQFVRIGEAAGAATVGSVLTPAKIEELLTN